MALITQPDPVYIPDNITGIISIRVKRSGEYNTRYYHLKHNELGDKDIQEAIDWLENQKQGI